MVEHSICVASRCVETGREFVNRAKGEASVFDLYQKETNVTDRQCTPLRSKSCQRVHLGDKIVFETVHRASDDDDASALRRRTGYKPPVHGAFMNLEFRESQYIFSLGRMQIYIRRSITKCKKNFECAW